MPPQPHPDDYRVAPVSAQMRRFAVQVQTGFFGIIVLSLVMLVVHG